MLKYTIMIVRSKISLTALIEKKTILELFHNKILETYNFLISEGYIIEKYN